MMSLRSKPIFYSLTAMVVLIAWFYQSSIYYDSDNSILLHEAARLLQGGTYAGQFFETSPPMILYLYLPVVLLAKLLALPFYLIFRIYLFVITLGCTALCYHLSSGLFHSEDKAIKNLFFLSLLAILFIFPDHELGQREDLYLMMSLPYCFLVARQLMEKQTATYLCVLIGVMAGIAFSIKPFFVLTPILLEIWVMLASRRWFSWWRTETITAFLTMLLYVMVSIWLNPDYYEVVIPYAMGTYYSGLAFSWRAMIFYPISVYCYLPLLLYALFYPQFKGYHRLITTLCVASLSFTLVYVVQRLPYYYHAVPGFLMAASLFELLISFFLLKFKKEQLDTWLLTAFVTIYLFFTFCYRESLWGVLAINPVMPWLYFFTVFSVLYCFFEKKLTWLNWAGSMILVFGITVIFSKLFAYAFPEYQAIFQTRFMFLMTVLFTLFLLCIRAPRYSVSTILTLSLLITLVFDYPTLIVATMYQRARNYKENTKPILSYMNHHMLDKTIYLFSSRGNTVFPLVDYTMVNVSSASRFPFFWMMPGLVKQLNSHLTAQDQAVYLKNRDLLIENITSDLEENKPDYVFVDVSSRKGNLLYAFEYLPYFTQNTHFEKAWQAYDYVTRLDGKHMRFDDTYHIAVYRRHLNT